MVEQAEAVYTATKLERCAYPLFGSKGLALSIDEKPLVRWAPSQKGLLAECPHRHREIDSLPPRSNAFPSTSFSRISVPTTLSGPLSLIMIS